VSAVPLVPSLLPLPIPTLETPTPSPLNSEYTSDMVPLSTHIPLLVRRTSHEMREFLLTDMIFHMISSIYGAFIASLDIISIPKCWQIAKRDPK
jgi:hypothetical protein